jgi:integrase
MRPIGRAAVDLLRAQPRYPDSDYVFPSIRYSVSGHFVGAPKLITRLCAAASIKRCTLHTLRHTFATVAATMGYSELTISALMGHSRGTVTSDYIHLPDPLLVSIADAVSARIVGLLDDNTYRLDENTHRTSP